MSICGEFKSFGMDAHLQIRSQKVLSPMSDTLTLTIRLHDPKEKKDPELSASWAVIEVPREDLEIGLADFLEKHVTPHLLKLKQLKLKAGQANQQQHTEPE